MKSILTNGRIFSRGFLFLLPLLLLYVMFSKKNDRHPKMITQNKSAREVFFLLLSRGFSVTQAMFCTAQAGHETGNFTSRIFKENNNCFGMKLALIRKTTATGEKYGHATFSSLKSCIDDFFLYYNNFKYLKTYNSLEDYVAALKKRGYFEASESEYLNGCKYWVNEYFSNSENEIHE